MENNSYCKEVPEEINKWSWAAFLLSPIWGIFNGVWSSLLCAIPGIGIIMHFVMGVYGNKWSWENKRWDSIEKFKRTQRKWTIAALIYLLILVVFITVGLMNREVTQGYINTIESPQTFATRAYDDAKKGQLSNYSGITLGDNVPPGWRKAHLSKETSDTRELLSSNDEVVYESPGTDNGIAFVNKGKIVKLSSTERNLFNQITVEKIKKVLGRPEKEWEEDGGKILNYQAGKYLLAFNIDHREIVVVVCDSLKS